MVINLLEASATEDRADDQDNQEDDQDQPEDAFENKRATTEQQNEDQNQEYEPHGNVPSRLYNLDRVGASSGLVKWPGSSTR